MKREGGRILIVDDELSVYRSACRALRVLGHELVYAENGEDALRWLDKEIEVIICDYQMPGLNGNEVLSRFRSSGNAAIRILLTGCGQMDSLIGAINTSQVFRYIAKPWDVLSFRGTVREALEVYEREDNRRAAEKEFKKSFEETWSELRGYQENARFVAHDLRNPLAAMRLGLQLMQDELEEAGLSRSLRFLDASLGSIDRLAEMASCLNDHGASDFSMNQANLSRIVRDVIEVERIVARSKGIAISSEGVRENCLVVMDEAAASRVVFNLVGNAVKYTREGGCEVSVHADGNGYVELRIADSGDGIPEEDKERIFGANQRLLMHEGIEGTGLGLAFCRGVVERFGGGLEVESEVGRGSVFTVRLPEATPLPQFRESLDPTE